MVAAFALLLPWLPGAAGLGLVPLPMGILVLLGCILGAYGLASEAAKRPFYARAGNRLRNGVGA
jgi:hypothetical protein